VYGRPLSLDEARTALPRASRLGGWLTIAGIVILTIYALTARVGQSDTHVLGSDSNTSFFTYIQVIRTIAEVLSRGMVTAVVFSTIFLYIVHAEWRMTREIRGEVQQEYHSQLTALERYMISRAAPYDPAELPPTH